MALPPMLIRLLASGAALLAASVACAQGSSRQPPTFRLPSAAAIAARTAPPAEPLWDDDAPRAPAPAPSFRTICVRLCDGFYFPISFQTTRLGLQADAARCQAKCGGAQLFFHANPGGDVASARSFTGLQYESLPNAFRHLKARVPGCGCTPEPWTTTEQERHHAYAEAARAKAAAAVPSEGSADETRGEGERPLALARRAPAQGSTLRDLPESASEDAQFAPAPAPQPEPAAEIRLRRVDRTTPSARTTPN